VARAIPWPTPSARHFSSLFSPSVNEKSQPDFSANWLFVVSTNGKDLFPALLFVLNFSHPPPELRIAISGKEPQRNLSSAPTNLLSVKP
jgi:hypothetical protein